jgi:hypothetical protein
MALSCFVRPTLKYLLPSHGNTAILCCIIYITSVITMEWQQITMALFYNIDRRENNTEYRGNLPPIFNPRKIKYQAMFIER